MDMPNVDLYRLLSPSGIVETIGNSSPNCSSSKQQQDLKQLIGPILAKDAIELFTSSGLELIAKFVDTNAYPRYLTLFFKYTKSERWDVAVEANERGMPIKVYYATGSINSTTSLLEPYDLLFILYKNPENVADSSFGLNKLPQYIGFARYICNTYYRRLLNKQFIMTQFHEDRK